MLARCSSHFDSKEGIHHETSSSHRGLRCCSLAAVFVGAARRDAGTPFVPGTGEFLADCCDDFEDTDWGYRYNHPKSSHEQDEKQRGPGGMSSNGLWHEGGKRGTPDLVKRVDTPPGGIEGSTGALLFATKNSGIPGRISNSQQQDDLLMMFNRRLGRSIPIAWQPSCTVRVYLPPFEEWENRTGPQFGMRADCRGRNPDGTVEEYWPGMFFLFRSETNRNIEKDFAKLTIRARPARQRRSQPRHQRAGLVDARHVVHRRRAGALLRQPGRRRPDRADDFLMSSFPVRHEVP